MPPDVAPTLDFAEDVLELALLLLLLLLSAFALSPAGTSPEAAWSPPSGALVLSYANTAYRPAIAPNAITSAAAAKVADSAGAVVCK